MENHDLKKMKEVLRDERLLRICSINPLTDEILTHFMYPIKYKPQIKQSGGATISLTKLQTQLQGIGNLNIKDGSNTNLMSQIQNMILKKVNDMTRKPANKFDDAFSAITGSQFGSPVDDNASSGGFENNLESKFTPRIPIKQANRLQARKIILQK